MQQYAKQITVIETYTKEGIGTTHDPVRLVTRWWTLEGKMLAERDEFLMRTTSGTSPWKPAPNAEDGNTP